MLHDKVFLQTRKFVILYENTVFRPKLGYLHVVVVCIYQKFIICFQMQFEI